MIELIIQTAKATAPILGGVSAIAALIQIAYKIKEVIYELKLKDEKFDYKFNHLESKIDSFRDQVDRLLNLNTSRMEAFENRLLEVERNKRS